MIIPVDSYLLMKISVYREQWQTVTVYKVIDIKTSRNLDTYIGIGSARGNKYNPTGFTELLAF